MPTKPKSGSIESPVTRIVILGTGTEVGKTWVTRTLAESLRRLNAWVVALKPVETGVPSDAVSAPLDPRATVRSVAPGPRGPRSDGSVLAEASSARPVPQPYTFVDPISPHLAARRAGRTIDLRQIVQYVEHHEKEVTSHVTSFVLVESAGGSLSPLDGSSTNLDLALALDPAIWILVAPDALGVLHDVTATLCAFEARGRLPDHLVLSAAREPDASTGSNASELALLGIATPAAVVGRGNDRALDDFAKSLLSRRAKPRK
jgi:dethiobiotin synthetase